MNIIVILNDTLRRDHVNAYGLPPPWRHPGHDGEPFIDTPNLDRLAAAGAGRPDPAGDRRRPRLPAGADLRPLGFAPLMRWTDAVGLGASVLQRYEEHQRRIRLVVAKPLRPATEAHRAALVTEPARSL